MRFPSDLIFIIVLVTSFCNVVRPEPMCMEFPLPWKPQERKHVRCPKVSASDTSHLRKREVLAPSNQLTFNGSDAFQVDFKCNSTPILCAKATKAFAKAGTIISGVLQFGTPVVVNASFLHFCPDVPDECAAESPSFTILGGTYAARMIPINDTDGVGRFYPQSLVKQFNYSNHPAYGPYDMVAMFNADANFWFDGDPPINRNQSDFLFVILHEFMHGLGFASAWNDYFNTVPQVLTPDITPLDTGDDSIYPTDKSPFTFQGFYEYAFDKYVVALPGANYISSPLSSLVPMSNITRSLNEFATLGTKFNTLDNFLLAFPRSKQYAIAKKAFYLGVHPIRLGFLPPNSNSTNDIMVLETSLNPFVQGSSISHCDHTLYSNSSDFLMRYVQERGTSMQMVIQNANGGEIAGGGPIGPELLSVLEAMGYATTRNSNPNMPKLSVISGGSRWEVGWVGMVTAVLVATLL